MVQSTPVNRQNGLKALRLPKPDYPPEEGGLQPVFIFDK
jgi:hypothetical protein